jgi:hypothetical protein
MNYNGECHCWESEQQREELRRIVDELFKSKDQYPNEPYWFIMEREKELQKKRWESEHYKKLNEKWRLEDEEKERELECRRRERKEEREEKQKERREVLQKQEELLLNPEELKLCKSLEFKLSTSVWVNKKVKYISLFKVFTMVQTSVKTVTTIKLIANRLESESNLENHFNAVTALNIVINYFEEKRLYSECRFLKYLVFYRRLSSKKPLYKRRFKNAMSEKIVKNQTCHMCKNNSSNKNLYRLSNNVFSCGRCLNRLSCMYDYLNPVDKNEEGDL